MAQASQALNLCRATAEFSGSTEQVEGEKLLLVASKLKLIHFSQLSYIHSILIIEMTRTKKTSCDE